MRPSPTWEPHIRTVWINTQCIADFKYILTPLTAALMVFSELCLFCLIPFVLLKGTQYWQLLSLEKYKSKK